MPQTRYVLSKAIALGKKPIVVINKVDKENCRPDEVHEGVFELMYNLDATEDQLDFPFFGAGIGSLDCAMNVQEKGIWSIATLKRSKNCRMPSHDHSNSGFN